MYIRPKVGEVYRAINDIQIMGGIIYKRPASSGFSAILPKGTRVVIMDDPPPGANGADVWPLNYRELEEKIISKEERCLEYYHGYGIIVLFEQLNCHFVKEAIDINQIRFDDKKIQKEWKFIVKKYKEQEGLRNWLYEGSYEDYQKKIKEIEKQIMEEDEAQGRAKIIRIEEQNKKDTE